MKKIWITWERHRRTSELVAALGDITLYELQLEAMRPVRYAWLLLRTAHLLIREKPDLVFIQSPSMVLALFMATVGKCLARYLVVDAHNEGVFPFHERHQWLKPLYRLVHRRADMTIVTNENLAAVVAQNRGRAVVLPDRVPYLGAPRRVALKGNDNIVFICTFEKDEPYRQVIESAALVDAGVQIYITGRYQKAPAEVIKKAAPNVTFTGFLSESDYANLLFSCNAVMDLTLMEDCLVCGAYEAVSLEKPMILSDTRALRDFFHSGAIYTGSQPEDIAKAMDAVIEDHERLCEEVQSLKTTLTEQWQRRATQLQAQILNLK